MPWVKRKDGTWGPAIDDDAPPPVNASLPTPEPAAEKLPPRKIVPPVASTSKPTPPVIVPKITPAKAPKPALVQQRASAFASGAGRGDSEEPAWKRELREARDAAAASPSNGDDAMDHQPKPTSLPIIPLGRCTPSVVEVPAKPIRRAAPAPPPPKPAILRQQQPEPEDTMDSEEASLYEESEPEVEQQVHRPRPPAVPVRMGSAPSSTSHQRSAPPVPDRLNATPAERADPYRPPLPSRQSSSSTASSERPPLPSRNSSPSIPVSSPLVAPHEPPIPPLPSARPPPTTSHRPPPMRSNASAGGAGLAPSAGPSWSDDKAGFAKSKAIEFGRNRRNCLDPPPACFARVPPAPTDETHQGVRITYAPLLEPVILRSNFSNDLARSMTMGRAFPSKPPTLTSHDVYAADWDQLYLDIDEAARIELRVKAGLSVATLPLYPIFGAGFVASSLAERKLAAKRVEPTCKLVEAWNTKFFRPRRLDVYIAQGSTRLSGPCPTTDSRRDHDPAYLRYRAATDEVEQQRAMKEMEKWEGKFRLVVRSWPPVE